MLSYRHRFLFIHVYKVAGTSVRAALAPFAHDPGRAVVNRVARRLHVAPRWPFHRWREFEDHVTAADVRAALPTTTWDGLFKFAFVRNPWDWQVSLYEYMRQNSEHPDHARIAPLSFKEYLECCVAWAHPQESWLVDEHGQLILDFVGRHASIASDFAAIAARLGISAELPRRKVTPHPDYRSYYAAAQAEQVARTFSADIKRFGFTFDDGALPRE